MALKEIEIRAVYDSEHKKVTATEKTVKIFGITVLKKRVVNPLLDKYEWHPLI